MNPRKTPHDEASQPTAIFNAPAWHSTDEQRARPAIRDAERAEAFPSPASTSDSSISCDSAVFPDSDDPLHPGAASGSFAGALSGGSVADASGFHDDRDDERLLTLAGNGDRNSFERLFSRYREDLRRVVAWRTDPRLRARVDPSDVVQEAQLEAFRRLDDYLRRRPMGFRLWLRKTAQEQLAKAFRRHVGTQMRSAGRETSLNDSDSPGVGAIAAPADTPSQHMAAQEAAQAVWEGLAELAENDREILIMRNYEGLNYDEICVVLDIEPAAARKRYGRALLRLRQKLAARGLTEDASQ